MNWFTQHRSCSIAGVVCASLSLTLLLFPALIFWLFAMNNEPDAVIMSHRAAVLFAGLAFLMWKTRDLLHSKATRVIFHSFALAMGGLALVGSYEFLRGNVGVGIALAIAAELAFVTVFIRLAARPI